MKEKRTIILLIVAIVVFSSVATTAGIVTNEGPGRFNYETIRGNTVEIYGKGLYKHMTADVAIQGIAQDYITLFAGIPALIISLILALRGSLKARIVLAGVTGYFFVTYLFYTTMGMYNEMFIPYLILLCLTFFTLVQLLLSFDIKALPANYSNKAPLRFTAGFLVFNAIAIAFLWLGIIVPPIVDGTLYPNELNHYTTLIVQGLDLGLLLPIAVVSGLMLLKKRPLGYLLVPVYTVFLSFLMAALMAKIIAMGINGVNIIPSVFIIPVFNLTAIITSVLTIKNLRQKV
jgi:hypothetical protein